jgi:hypothetical protein
MDIFIILQLKVRIYLIRCKIKMIKLIKITIKYVLVDSKINYELYIFFYFFFIFYQIVIIQNNKN